MAEFERSSALDVEFLCKSKCNVQFHNKGKRISITELRLFFQQRRAQNNIVRRNFFQAKQFRQLAPKKLFSCVERTRSVQTVTRENVYMVQHQRNIFLREIIHWNTLWNNLADIFVATLNVRLLPRRHWVAEKYSYALRTIACEFKCFRSFKFSAVVRKDNGK